MGLVWRGTRLVKGRVKLFVDGCDGARSRKESPREFGGRCSVISPTGIRDGKGRWTIKRILGVMAGALATCGSMIYLMDESLTVMATGLEAKPPSYPWPTNRLLSSLDHSSIRRGWQVYRSVCSTCHAISFVRFEDLVDVSYTKEEMRAIAAQYDVEDGPDEEGNYYKRPGKLHDRVPAPFPNEEAARAANNGAYPVDLSFVINARRSGRNYVFSLLTGYTEPPAGVELSEGQLFNAYFPGGAISMPEMLQDGIVDFEDGTPATRSQIAKDVVEFLAWTADQRWDERKVACIKGIGVSAILLALVAGINRARWAVVKNQHIFHLPKMKKR